jgi:UPF0716 family protein affecting phage T7 exclusion
VTQAVNQTQQTKETIAAILLAINGFNTKCVFSNILLPFGENTLLSCLMSFFFFFFSEENQTSKG